MSNDLNIDAEFDFMVEELGGFDRCLPLDREQLERFNKLFPRSLFNFFQRYGVGSLLDGLLNVCDPRNFSSILALVFRADKDFHHNDCSAVSYTAFGFLTLWSQKYGVIGIDLPRGMVLSQAVAPTRFKDESPMSARYAPNDDRVTFGILPFSKDRVDYWDYLGEPMYDRCQERHGKLAADECYGFFPALAITGALSPAQSVDNIRRVKAREHFALLAQLDTFYLTRVGPDGFERVRPIG